MQVTTPFVKQSKAAEMPNGIDFNSRIYQVSANETIDCGQYANCTNRRRSCYCDELCSRYNDCCPDVANISDSLSTSSDIKIASSSCQSLLMDKHSPVWFVSRCSGSEKGCIQNQTTTKNIEDIIPVTGSDGFVYVNGKCAHCHGIHQYTHWYLSITENHDCKVLAQTVSTSVLNEMLWNDDCGLYLYHPYGMPRPRRCVKNIKIVEGCPTERSPVTNKLEGPSYQNEMCCIKDTMSHCTVHQYTCFTDMVEDPLTPDDLAGKYSRLSLHSSTVLLQFKKVRFLTRCQ